jgi:hypothetical protein
LSGHTIQLGVEVAVGEIWNDYNEQLITNEASVELHVVLPLLESLGYANEDIAPKHPVIRQQGRGRNPEADFVVFYGVQRTKSNSLITVEAKAPGESFDGAKAQGESYAQAIGTPLLLVTDGRLLEIWQLQPSSASECVLKCSLTRIGENQARIEALLSKEAAFTYCKTLQHKSALSVAVDLSAYLQSELASHVDDKHSWQRSLCEGTQQDFVPADQVLAQFRKGAVIYGASGFGKSTLASQLLFQSAGVHLNGQSSPIPCQIQLADMAASKQSIVTYVHARIRAHCPAIGEALLGQLMREHGLTLFCDGFDRLISEQARVIEAALREVVRDFPLSQIFIFTRPGALPDLSMPELSLQPLNHNEQKALLEARSLDASEADSILRNMPRSLSQLAVHPLLLTRIGSYWQDRRAYPSRLEALFEAWLDQLLAPKTQSISHLTMLRRGLTALAWVTVQSPVTAAHALDLLAGAGIADKVLDELVSRDALRNSGMTVELHHEALADYLRALDVVASDERLDTFLAQPLAVKESLFSVLLMAVLPTRERQKQLWERLAQTSLTTYLEALRYRSNLATEFNQQETAAVSEAYLADMLNSIKELSRCFFPQLSGAILQELTGCDSGDLVISGELINDREWISYQFDIAGDPAAPQVTVGGANGRRYGVSLKVSDLRIDSGRLVGAKRLLECLCQVVEARNLKGRQTWINERLMGRVRFLEPEFWRESPRGYGLQELEKLLAPDADKEVSPPGCEQFPCFTVQSMLDDIRWLLRQGQELLVPWWLEHVDPLTLAPQTEAEHQRILDEHFRRVQLAYVEVCEESFPEFANEFGMYCAMPIRWEVQLEPATYGRSLRHRWRPVAEWCQAGADVSFVNKTPTDFLGQDFQEVDRELRKLGRRCVGTLRGGGSMAQVPRFNGFTWRGSFNGETSVMHEVCDWIKEDVERLFRPLPSRDSD